MRRGYVSAPGGHHSTGFCLFTAVFSACLMIAGDKMGSDQRKIG